MKQLYLDCETTGLDSVKNSIHQISGLIVIDNKELGSFNLKFRPREGCVIDEKAFKKCNLTIDEVMSRPMSYTDGISTFIKILNKYKMEYHRL